MFELSKFYGSLLSIKNHVLDQICLILEFFTYHERHLPKIKLTGIWETFLKLKHKIIDIYGIFTEYKTERICPF